MQCVALFMYIMQAPKKLGNHVLSSLKVQSIIIMLHKIFERIGHVFHRILLRHLLIEINGDDEL